MSGKRVTQTINFGVVAAIALLSLGSIAAPLRPAFAQVLKGKTSERALTNAEIVEMVKGGKSESEVIATIKSRAPKFDLSPDQLIALHKAGVSSNVLKAMQESSSSSAVGQAALKAALAKPPVPGRIIRMTRNPRAMNANAAILAVLQKQRNTTDAEIAQTKLRIQKQGQAGLVGGPLRTMSADGSVRTAAPAGMLTAPQQQTRTVGNGNQGGVPAAMSPTPAASGSKISTASQGALAARTNVQMAPSVKSIGSEKTSSASVNTSSGGTLLAQSGNSAAPQPVLQGTGIGGSIGGSGNPGSNGGISSRINVLPHLVNDTALVCANDPTFRILSVSGSYTPATFTPTDQYNLYTITGCSFGSQAPTNDPNPTDWVHVYGGSGSFYGKFAIKFWSDNEIDVSLDEFISGFPDLDNLNLVVKRADGQQAQKGGFKFYAARQTVLLQTIPQSWVTLASFPTPFHDPWTTGYSSPPASPVPPFGSSPYPVPAIPPPGPSAGSAYVSRSSNGTKYAWLDGVNDYYDFSQLAPGWTTDNFEVDPYDQRCPAGGGWSVTYKQSFGTWSAQWDGNNIRVGLSDTSCSGFFAPNLGISNYQNWSGSYYALKVWVTGPRGTDPLTDKGAQ